MFRLFVLERRRFDRKDFAFASRIISCLALSLFFCAIISEHSLAEVHGLSVKSQAALADARKIICYNDSLWAAGGGLTRYDLLKGSTERYLVEQGLAANAVFDIAVDGKNSVLWIATSSGLGRLDLKTGLWKFLGRTEGLSDLFVLSLATHTLKRQTRLFIGTRTGGLYFLKEGSDKITPAIDKKQLPDKWISCMVLDPGRNYLWIGTASGVVRCKPGRHGLQIDPILDHNSISAKRLLVDEQTGDVFCLNEYSEIFLYKLLKKKWEKIPFSHGNIEISDLVLDPTKNLLWTATTNGIYGYHIKQKQWIKLRNSKADVSCIAIDPKNHVLYYVARQGILANNPKNTKPRLFLPNSPPFNNTVNAITIDNTDDVVWMGTDWGIAKFEQRTKKWRFYDLPLYPKERVVALSADNNNVWFGTMYHGLGRLDPKTGAIEEIKGTPEDSTVTCVIADDSMKKVWFGLWGSTGGVYKYDIDKKELDVLPLLDNLSVTFMIEDGDWIWVGTGRGVARFHKSKGPGADPFEQLPPLRDVLTLAIDNKRNHLWITTEHEVVLYDITKNRHRIFKCADGFPWSPITSILFDGNLVWFGTEGYGLYVFDPTEKSTNALTRIEGTADRYIISLSHDKRHGSIWAGTVSGGISIISEDD